MQNKSAVVTLVLAIVVGVGVFSASTGLQQAAIPVPKAYFNSPPQASENCDTTVNPTTPVCAIVKALRSAQSKVLIAMYQSGEGSPNDPDGRAMRRVLLDTVKALRVFTRVRFGENNLIESGSPARLKDFLEGLFVKVCTGHGLTDNGILHDKFLVIDDQLVITGSLNWNSNSLEDNRENIVVIESQDLARQYTDEFRRIWNDNRNCGAPGF